MLPSMNADTLLERLRADARTRDLRILILSNLPGTDHGEIDVAFAAGVLAWLEKSKTTPACLADRIREALAAREEVGASL